MRRKRPSSRASAYTNSAVDRCERQENSPPPNDPAARDPIAHLRQVLELLEQATRSLKALLTRSELGESIHLESTHGPRKSPDKPAVANVLTRQGEAWLVRFGAQSVFARDSLGFGYLVQLLQRPWQPLHALELFASVHRRTTHTQAGVPDDKGGRRKALVDSILEQGAVSEFRKRLVDLENEIEAAERNHDLARLEAATREREWLLQEIRRSRKASGVRR